MVMIALTTVWWCHFIAIDSHNSTVATICRHEAKLCYCRPI